MSRPTLVNIQQLLKLKLAKLVITLKKPTTETSDDPFSFLNNKDHTIML